MKERVPPVTHTPCAGQLELVDLWSPECLGSPLAIGAWSINSADRIRRPPPRACSAPCGFHPLPVTIARGGAKRP